MFAFKVKSRWCPPCGSMTNAIVGRHHHAPVPGVDPKPGDVLVVGTAANRRYAGENQILLRVIRVLPTQARHGWVWLYGYEVDQQGLAKKRRAVLALRDGLKPIQVTIPRPAPREFTVMMSLDRLR